MYKKILIAAIALTACLTGCGEKTEESTAPTELPIKVQEVEMTDVSATEAETTEATTAEGIEVITDSDAETVEDEPLVLTPTVDVNVPAETDFSLVTINGVEVNTLDTNLQAILDSTGITHCPFGTTSVTFGDIDFVSGMFGIQKDESDISSFGGTNVSIEVLDSNGEVVEPSELDSNLFGEYRVKAIHTSEFFTEDDFEVLYFGGIKCNMPEEDVKAILGEGVVFDDDPFGKTYAYNNGVQTLLVEIEDGVVDGIVLINNN